MSTPLAALLLADGRFPAGTHAHSGGIEAAVLDGRVTGEQSLERYVRARLVTVGLSDAALAAATMIKLGGATDAGTIASTLVDLDDQAAARLVAPPLREASRRLGRQLLRVAERCWPDAIFVAIGDLRPTGLHQPVALGVVGIVAGLEPRDVARLAVHQVVATPAQAAVRLLGLDPVGAAAIVARLSPMCDEVIEQALSVATGAVDELPARSSPLLDIVAVEHDRRDSRLFAT